MNLMTVVSVFVWQVSDDAERLSDDGKYLEEIALLKRNLERYWQQVDAANDN